MSGPNPPGREPDEPESEPVSDTGDERASGNHLPPVAGGGDKLPSDQTGETDAYSRAYSAPESEHVTGGPYVPADLRLYDYDDYEESSDLDDELAAPRWPWVVGVAAIIAAVALVVSVSLLVTRPHTSKLATGDTTSSAPPVQDEITTTKPAPPPPPPAPPPWSRPWPARARVRTTRTSFRAELQRAAVFLQTRRYGLAARWPLPTTSATADPTSSRFVPVWRRPAPASMPRRRIRLW